MVIQKRNWYVLSQDPLPARSEPLFYANRILNIYDLNVIIVGVFITNVYLNQSLFDNYFCTNRDIHGRETRNADVPYVMFHMAY